MQPNYSEVELLTFISKFRKRRKIRRRSFKPSEKSETRHFYVVVVQRRQRKVKKHAASVELLFCLFNLLLLFAVLVAVDVAVVASLNVMLHETIRNDDF